jgi:hypothetical protein
MVSRCRIDIIPATPKATEGNKSEAARGLTITRNTLHHKLHKARGVVAGHLAVEKPFFYYMEARILEAGEFARSGGSGAASHLLGRCGSDRCLAGRIARPRSIPRGPGVASGLAFGIPAPAN